MKFITLNIEGLRLVLCSIGASAVSLHYRHFPHSMLCSLPQNLYPVHSQHFGAVAGPVANRIATASALLDGQPLMLEANDGKHCLHSGSNGLGRREWQLDSQHDNSAKFICRLKDGELGLPGNREFSAYYALQYDKQKDCHTLLVELGMISDQTTFCNLAFHPYFCLDNSGSILSHNLHVNASHFLATDNENIPTGERIPLHGSPFDFSESKQLSMLDTPVQQVLDHNFCLHHQDTGLNHAASLKSIRSGIHLTLSTNQRGLQIYCPRRLNDQLITAEGNPFGRFPSICLEPQGWPDAPNHPDFPSIIAEKGQNIVNRSTFSFNTD